MCLQLCAANDKSFIFISKMTIPSSRFQNLQIWRETSDSQSRTHQTHTFTTTDSKVYLFDALSGVPLEIFLMAPTKIHVATVMRSIKGMKNG